jgi:glutamine amidotransferase
MIAIVEYGMGNVRSLRNAFEYIGEDVIVTADPAELEAADCLVLPGVGAFGDAMRYIAERSLEPVLRRQALEIKKPVLGVCLGMQLIALSSVEHGEHRGLGWIDAEISRLEVLHPLKVPHVGWNTISFDPADPLFHGIKITEANFYFVHSFHMVCHNSSEVVATTHHGSPLTAVIRSGNITATQFHPEKSQDNGLTLLRNWVGISAC